jgi:hypothetical protein
VLSEKIGDSPDSEMEGVTHGGGDVGILREVDLEDGDVGH